MTGTPKDAARRRERLDRLLVERGMAPTREKARALVLAGVVLVGEARIDKPGTQVFRNADIRVKGDTCPYVSRGGLKIEAALDEFAIEVTGLVALDVGASTGGFTDCLLKRGARRVYALDVGYGQFAWSLRTDPRVTLFEKTNIRYFDGTGIEDTIDIAVIDVSFISLRLVLPVVAGLVKKGGVILALVKPQFEAGKGEVGKGGVVKDPAVHTRVLDEVLACARGLNLTNLRVCDSPITGPAGNREFFLAGENGGKASVPP